MLLTKQQILRLQFIATFMLTALIAAANGTKPGKDSLLNQRDILATMRKVADWQLKDWKVNGPKHPSYDWTNAASYAGIYALGTMRGNNGYLDPLIRIGKKLNWQTGPNRFVADDYCIAQTYVQLSMKYHDKSMIQPFIMLADSIVAKPHDKSIVWNNAANIDEWAWCDALFMGPPALSYLSIATKDPKYLNTATKLWWKTTNYLYDKKEHLFFRDSRFFTKREKNGKKVFWSRGNGWVMAGLVRVMENIPASNPERAKFEKLYKQMAQRIAALQQPDGSWHASLLDPASYPVKETSGTGFYCYALLWGLNHGLLDKSYWPVAKKAWAAISSSVHPDGMLGFVQQVGESPDAVNAESTEVYGVGAFLLAGAQLYKYVGSHSDLK
ncbi:MAG: glycoside hydrolase family 88 protein [Bacteroidota bacterium]